MVHLLFAPIQLLRGINRSVFAVSHDIITCNGAAKRGEVVNHTGAQRPAWPRVDWVIYRPSLFYAWLDGLLTQGGDGATSRGELALVVGLGAVSYIYKFTFTTTTFGACYYNVFEPHLRGHLSIN